MKIFNDIINNPSQISRYGNLNFDTINKQLSMCQPALQLFIAGFNVEIHNDKSRLIWRNTS